MVPIVRLREVRMLVPERSHRPGSLRRGGLRIGLGMKTLYPDMKIAGHLREKHQITWAHQDSNIDRHPTGKRRLEGVRTRGNRIQIPS